MMSQCPINANEKLPWGWHFFPTPQELINNLRKKVENQKEETVCESQDASDVLREIDLSQVEPWEIKGFTETCSIRATHADEQHQFFYAQKEQKYRHGRRNNRATKGGFWKATGRDKPIHSLTPKDTHKKVIGFRKALVFYEGRAPNGTKTDWILHEYRLKSVSDNAIKDEQWVACHMFVKERNTQRREPDAVEIAAVDSKKEQLNEWVDVPHHQQGANVKPEPGYHQSCSFVAPTSNPPCEGDDWNLPGLRDESTYSAHRPSPIDVAVQLPRVTTGRMPSFDLTPRQTTGGRMMTSMTSFDQVPRPMPARQFASSFDERPITDILFDIYADQMQPSGVGFDPLW